MTAARSNSPGAALKLGYFAQESLDVLDPGLTIWDQAQRDFPRESVGALRFEFPLHGLAAHRRRAPSRSSRSS